MGAAIKDLPHLAWWMTRAEVSYMVQYDRFLLVLMALSLVYLFVRVKDVAVGLYIGALAGTYVLILANGIPSFMRYESVLFPIAVLCLAALVHRVVPDSLRGGSASADLPPDSGAEPQPTWWQGSPRRVQGLAASAYSPWPA